MSSFESLQTKSKLQSNPLGNIIQPKLKIGQPNDKYEQEADRIADQVMRMPDPQVQMRCKEEKKKERLQMQPLKGNESLQMKPRIQHKVSGSGKQTASPGIASGIAVSKGSGRSLDKGVSTEMGSKMGADFSGVHIHTDSKSHQLNRQLGSKAFAHGEDIYFNEGEYKPDLSSGKRLLAHELTHVVQQDNVRIQRRLPDNISGYSGADAERDLNKRIERSLNSLKDEDLYREYDKLVRQIQRKDKNVRVFESQLESISTELSKRALRAGRTFSNKKIVEMKKYFKNNAKSKNHDSCIVTMNKGLKIVLDDEKQSTGSRVNETMDALNDAGRAGGRVDIEFLDSKGKQTKGTKEPVKLSTSVWDTVIKMAKRDVGWSVFGMSIMDGFHSVTLSLDNKDLNNPKIYWSDQWSSGGGWEKMNRDSFDKRITNLTKDWWNRFPTKGGGKQRTRVSLWRVNS